MNIWAEEKYSKMTPRLGHSSALGLVPEGRMGGRNLALGPEASQELLLRVDAGSPLLPALSLALSWFRTLPTHIFPGITPDLEVTGFPSVF